MMINTNAIVSASEANQNFSRVTRIADAQGQAVIFKKQQAQIPAGRYRVYALV